MTRLALALAALSICVALGGYAAAQPDEIPPASTPAELLDAARGAEKEGSYARALVLYGMVVTQAPQSRQARHAAKRRRFLEARSEGDFGPLRRLADMRRRAPSRSALDAFAAEVPGFPDGINKREAWQLLGDTYLKQQNDPEAALAAYRAWLASPDLSESERLLAVSGAALARAELEGAAPSLADMNREHLGHRAEAIALRAKVVARVGVPMAWALVLAFAGLGLGLTRARGLRPAALRSVFTRARLAAAFWLLGVPLLLVFRYDHRLGPQFAWLVMALAAVVTLAAMVGAGQPSPRHRRGLAGLAALATLATAFLAVEHSRMLLDLMLALEHKPS